MQRVILVIVDAIFEEWPRLGRRNQRNLGHAVDDHRTGVEPGGDEVDQVEGRGNLILSQMGEVEWSYLGRVRLGQGCNG